MAAAFERNGLEQAAGAAGYLAEAGQLRRRADLEASDHQGQVEEADQDDTVAAASAEPSATEPAPFGFINPF